MPNYRIEYNGETCLNTNNVKSIGRKIGLDLILQTRECFVCLLNFGLPSNEFLP